MDDVDEADKNLADLIIENGPYGSTAYARIRTRLDDIPNILSGTADDLNALRDELSELRHLVYELADPDPCWFDHHGGCQAHGFLSLEPGEKCPNARAQELLAKWRG